MLRMEFVLSEFHIDLWIAVNLIAKLFFKHLHDSQNLLIPVHVANDLQVDWHPSAPFTVVVKGGCPGIIILV